jgi:LacI family transcriptional regulator
MTELARAADVSPSTVARVLNESGYVAEETRVRVLEAVRSTGYRPNVQARSLRTQRSFTLGLALSSARDNPFFTHISHAIRVAAAEAGYSLLTINHGYSAEAEAAGIHQFMDYGVEGVILCHPFEPQAFAQITRAGKPVVQIERRAIPDAHSVIIDAAAGISEAIALFVGNGHRRIAFIGGAADTSYTEDHGVEADRVKAFRLGILAAGLAIDECPVLATPYRAPSREDPLPGYTKTMEIFGSAGPHPTAVLTGSDVFAAGALQAFAKLGLEVPQDVSLIGYDDSFAHFLAPPLASIAQPYEEIGRKAIELIQQALKSGSSEPLTAHVKTWLQYRPSVAPVSDRS